MTPHLLAGAENYKEHLLLWRTQHAYALHRQLFDFTGNSVILHFPCGGTVEKLNTSHRLQLFIVAGHPVIILILVNLFNKQDCQKQNFFF